MKELFYYITKYSFDGSAVTPAAGPYTTFKAVWEAMRADAKNEERIDKEENDIHCRYEENESFGEITLTNVFHDREEVTSYSIISIEVPESESNMGIPLDVAAVYRMEGGDFLYLQISDTGYDYTFYRSDFTESDCGQLDNPDLSMLDAVATVLAINDRDDRVMLPMSVEAYDALQTRVKNYSQSQNDTSVSGDLKL